MDPPHSVEAVASSVTDESRTDELAQQLRDDGVVILRGAFDVGFVEELRAAFMPLLERYVDASGPNRGTRRHQMYLPFEPPFSDPRLWAAPAILDVVERVLGPNFECTYYGSDTPYPGSEHQPAHQDGDPLFPEWPVRPPMYSVSLNVPLVDVDDATGPLEWFAGGDRPVADAEPRRFVGPAGIALLRDPRVWHRGSPNTSDEPRPMLAINYTRDWYRFALHRPALDRAVYEELPEPGRRLFRNADITPAARPDGDRRRLGPYAE